jgi:hypothetical protein
VIDHSFGDGILQLGVNIVVQRYTYFTLLVPWIASTYVKSRCARLFHNLIVILLLTESHADPSDVRGSRKVARNFPSLFPGVVQHRAHHSGQEPRRFQQFFSYMDGWSKTRDDSVDPLRKHTRRTI